MSALRPSTVGTTFARATGRLVATRYLSGGPLMGRGLPPPPSSTVIAQRPPSVLRSPHTSVQARGKYVNPMTIIGLIYIWIRGAPHFFTHVTKVKNSKVYYNDWNEKWPFKGTYKPPTIAKAHPKVEGHAAGKLEAPAAAQVEKH